MVNDRRLRHISYVRMMIIVIAIPEGSTVGDRLIFYDLLLQRTEYKMMDSRTMMVGKYIESSRSEFFTLKSCSSFSRPCFPASIGLDRGRLK